MSNTNQPASIWFAVDEDGDEWCSDKQITKFRNTNILVFKHDAQHGKLFPGAIQAITGKTLTWDDDPIEWKPGEVKEPRKAKWAEFDGNETGYESQA